MRIAARPDPLWETVLSLHVLRHRDRRFAPWRQALGPRPRDALGMLLPLVPPRGYFPDFLTPPQASAGMTAGIDALCATPDHRIGRDLAILTARAPVPRWVHRLAGGDTGLLGRLGECLRAYHDAAIALYAARMRPLIDGDRALRGRDLMDGGVHLMLDRFRPLLRWRPPVLEASYPVDQDLHLDGRGLLLVPSLFCRHRPITLADPALPPVLVYPVAADTSGRARPAGDPAGRNAALATLLGRTRAAALVAISTPCSTGELADRVGVSPSSASEHAQALRDGGLIVTYRRGGGVRHTLTPIGSDLLRRHGVPVAG